MIRQFRRLISIGNLMGRRAERRAPPAAGSDFPFRIPHSASRIRKGQVATFLLLMLVVVLIFAMLIANLGQVSLQATTVANAADSAALLLGSQLATTSNQIYTALGHGIQCRKGGFFTILLIIVVVIIVIISCFTGCWGIPLLIWAIAAGAAAGAVGGAISGTGAAQGAIQGAIIGAAMGAGAGIGAKAGLVLGATIGAPVGASTGALALTLSTIGAVAFTALAAGSALYNAVVAEQDIQAAIASASKLLNRLSNRRRILEGVILSALTQTVDDPETVADTYDLDGDGDTQERVSRFIHLWASRLMGVTPTGIQRMEDRIAEFATGPLARFRAAVERAYRVHEAGVIRGAEEAATLEAEAEQWFEDQNITPAGGWSQWLGCIIQRRKWRSCEGLAPSFLGRSQIENRVQGANGRPDDVTMEELVVPLEDTTERSGSTNTTPYPVPFWDEGPTLEEYANWGAEDPQTEEEERNVLAPPGWDQVDGAIEALVEFVETYDSLQFVVERRADNPAALSELTMGWQSWVPNLYDPELDQFPP
ncbi:MAG TPA: hypothetical protein DDX89_00690, partial [Candidatus Omnitrophica bacterium]|nr:hypothetical protein [Candidatus Omnitrophota bacterium]